MSLANEIILADTDAVRVALSELKKMADPNCKKCFGRGHVGRDTITNNYHICGKCLRKSRGKPKQR